MEIWSRATSLIAQSNALIGLFAFEDQFFCLALKNRQRESEAHGSHNTSHASGGKRSSRREVLGQDAEQQRAKGRETAQHHCPYRHPSSTQLVGHDPLHN